MSGRPLRSLHRYLMGWLVAVLLLIWGVQLVVAWQAGHHEAEEITDGQLISVARLWLGSSQAATVSGAALIAPERVRDYVQDVAVLRWLDGRLVTDTHGLAAQWPADTPFGFGVLTLEHGSEKNLWRVYLTEQMSVPGVDRLAVLMNVDHRVDLGLDVAQRMAEPILFLMPLSLGLMLLALRRGLRPLKDLSDDIAALQGRPGERLHRAHRFEEFNSTVQALHGLMDRLDAQLAHERAFASDLAHELRTPLTSLALQARAIASDSTSEYAQALEADALRAGEILSQLLALARAESGREPLSAPLDLHDCVAGVLSELAQAALDSDHDLSLSARQEGVTVRAEAVAVELAVRNLVDNALRHTPSGSRIAVSVWRRADALGVTVEDWPLTPQAPGGAWEPGLGLGLRLVERLVMSQGATLEVLHKTEGGRTVHIRWPIALSD